MTRKRADKGKPADDSVFRADLRRMERDNLRMLGKKGRPPMRYFKSIIPALPVRVFRVRLPEGRSGVPVAQRWERDHWQDFCGILHYVSDYEAEAVNVIKEITKAEAEMIMRLDGGKRDD